MSTCLPGYPEKRTLLNAVGTSHLCQAEVIGRSIRKDWNSKVTVQSGGIVDLGQFDLALSVR
jgi:hypothetical protein